MFPLKKPTELRAFCAKSKNDMLSMRPAAKPRGRKVS